MTVRLIEWQVPYTGGTAIEITADKVINLLLRAENNLLWVNGNNELYCDLQLENWIAPTDDFPVWVTTWIVNANDGRSQNWLLLHYETTSWAYAQWLYGEDWKLYFDGWTWTFKKVYYSDDVDTLIQNLANSISAVWYSWEYSDLLHRPGIVEVSYSLADNERIVNWTIIDNCTVLITPYNNTVPATLTIDWVNYTVTWNNGNDLTVYWAEPLVCLYQTDWTHKYFNSFLRAYDNALDSVSENAVQNKVVKAALDLKLDAADLGDATLTIQKNGTTLDTFTANSKTNKTVNVTVPTALSDLTNDVVNDGNLTIKRNHTTIAEFSANDATNVIADLDVPELVNNTSTPDSSKALTAAMGKELQDQIDNISAIWRFLSIWNCATWLPLTNPTVSPYTYKTWDYYIVWNVSLSTNYKPDGWTYTNGVASTTVETATVDVWDMYVYDWLNRALRKTTWQTMPIDNVLSTTSTNAVENRVVTYALMEKADLVNSPTNWDLAWLDANWNLTDSWIAATTVELNTNKETWSTLTDSIISYPSSHTVKELVDSLVTWVSSVNTQTWAVVLDADDISDSTTTNKFVTATDKTNWDGKQAALTLPATPTQWNLVVRWANNKTFADGWSIPVTSVNGSTGAVTVETPNIKTFTLSWNNDLTTAQAAYDWYVAWKNPVLMYGDATYNLMWISPLWTTMEFSVSNPIITHWSTSSNLEQSRIIFTISSDTITAIAIFDEVIAPWGYGAFLSPAYNYITPYTPLYDWSPATKKYVDDAVSSKIAYSEFEFKTATSWATLIVSDLNTNFTPNQNFTIACGTVKEGMQYIVRINSWATVYNMSLWTWVTNLFGEDLTLTASKTTTLVFLATSSSTLELFSARTAS